MFSTLFLRFKTIKTTVYRTLSAALMRASRGGNDSFLRRESRTLSTAGLEKPRRTRAVAASVRIGLEAAGEKLNS